MAQDEGVGLKTSEQGHTHTHAFAHTRAHTHTHENTGYSHANLQYSKPLLLVTGENSTSEA